MKIPKDCTVTIIPRETVRAAVERALCLDPCMVAAIAVAAAALAIPVEAVREVMQESESPC